MSEERLKRLHSLDGLRGWAALSVVVYHVFFETFGELFPVFRSPGFHFLMDGRLAVALFFILSGQVLAAAALRSNTLSGITDQTARRYPRLALPVFASCAISLMILMSGLTFNIQAAAIVGREDWLGAWLTFAPSTIGMVWDALIRTFVTDTPDYNPFLWTMFYELQGSFYVFALALLNMRMRNPLRLLVPVALAALHFQPLIACFFLGTIAHRLDVSGIFAWLKNQPRFQQAALAAVPLLAVADITIFRIFGLHDKLIVLLALSIVLIAQTSIAVGRMLESRLSQFLGAISFPLYLLHFSVMVSFMSWAIIRAGKDTLSLSEAVVIGVYSIILSIAAAQAFMPVEALAKRFSGRISRFLRAGRVPDLRQPA